MKRSLYLILFLFSISFYAQTQVGDFRFNDVETFEGKELMLNGAGQREDLYAVALYLDFEVEGVEDGVMVADKDVTMALTIKTTSFISNEHLEKIIRTGLERATDGNSYLLEDQIREFFTILPEVIHKYEIFKIIYTNDGKLTMYMNQVQSGTMSNSLEFKQALFKIWLGENPVDVELKEDLLGSFEPNPVLGQWKTYNKKTGVAVNLIQLYVIEDRLYGSINRMLRESERDAVCYECEGDDQNHKVEGLVILKQLKDNGSGKYVGGKYTDITNGKVSDCQLWIDKEDQDILNVKYKGGGGVHRWKRVKEVKRKGRGDFRTAKGF